MRVFLEEPTFIFLITELKKKFEDLLTVFPRFLVS